MEFSSNIFWNSSSQFELYSNWSCWQVLLNHGQALAFDEIDTKSTIDNRYVAQPALILCLLIEPKTLYTLRLLAIALEARKNGKNCHLRKSFTKQQLSVCWVKGYLYCFIICIISYLYCFKHYNVRKWSIICFLVYLIEIPWIVNFWLIQHS